MLRPAATLRHPAQTMRTAHERERHTQPGVREPPSRPGLGGSIGLGGLLAACGGDNGSGDTTSSTTTSTGTATVQPSATAVRWVVGGDGPWPRKPAPEGMWHLMQQASAAPDETVLIGDSAIDLQTSRNAGVAVCLARYGFGFADLSADALRGDESLVNTPAEIADVVYARR